MHRRMRMFAAIGLLAALAIAFAAPGSALAAQAESTGKAPAVHAVAANTITGTDASINATLHFTQPYLLIDNKPQAWAVLIDGGKGRPGLLDVNAGRFSSNFPPFPVALEGWFDKDNLCGSDGQCGFVTGYAVLGTPYGGAIYSTQFQPGRGRFGVVNIHSGLFYPQSIWYPTVS